MEMQLFRFRFIFHIILMLKASSYTTKTRAEGPLDGLAGMFQ